jgi:hypothetical protein
LGGFAHVAGAGFVGIMFGISHAKFHARHCSRRIIG